MSKILFLFLLVVASCQDNISKIEIFENRTLSDEVEVDQSYKVDGKNKMHMTSSDVASKTGDTSCTTEMGVVGVCVSYLLCDVNNTSEKGFIDVAVRDAPCESYRDTCCPLDKRRSPEDLVTSLSVKKQRDGCGWRIPELIGSQLNGAEDEAKFGEFPWMVAVLLTDSVSDSNSHQPYVYVGGGSLIHPSVVLTTAHYVAKANKLRVRVGEWDTQTTKEIYPYQDRDVGSIEIHKDFEGGNLFYDVALLFLMKPMDLAPNVGVACLPPPKQKAPSGARCFSTGWGKDKFGKEGRYQVILKKIELPVVAHRTCRDLLRKTRLGTLFELHSTFMCAGGETGKNTCIGDSGAPLSCPIEYQENRYVQYGMVAWGIGCGEDGTPGVYVDVSVLRDWIDDKVAGKGYDPSVYSRY